VSTEFQLSTDQDVDKVLIEMSIELIEMLRSYFSVLGMIPQDLGIL